MAQCHVRGLAGMLRGPSNGATPPMFSSPHQARPEQWPDPEPAQPNEASREWEESIRASDFGFAVPARCDRLGKVRRFWSNCWSN